MLLYFAYGSNMLRARLEARVGPVAVLGRGYAEHYFHSFTKRGRDGTGKGNITPMSHEVVHGVLYGLARAQMALLASFEGGYKQVSLPVTGPGGTTMAGTFQATAPVAPMVPTAEYLSYYERGMLEHGLPAAYRAFVLAQAKLE